jgi:hypothetical protein
MRHTARTLAALAALTLVATAAAPKFYEDDPVWVERDHQPAAAVRPWRIDLMANVLINLLGNPGDPETNVRAKNLNTVDEVPDSSWFTNRLGHRPIAVEEIAKGPDTSAGPVPGRWTVTSSKSDGVTPGFTIRDSSGQVWFLKFDPPGYRAMSTGTEVAVTKLMWALGYNVSENHIALFRRDQLAIGDSARFTPPGATARPMRGSDIDALLKRANREPDGSYRVVASRAVEGTPLGGFRFQDTRPDDPNDVVPHEHRRELRGYRVFAAWLNQFDANAINSLDTLVNEDGRARVRHYFIDFGSTLGSGGAQPRQYWEGYEFLVEPGRLGWQMLSFGLAPSEAQTIDLYEAPSIGRMPRDNSHFDPDRWKPRVPNAAFRHARADDRFWAAQKLAAVTDDMLKAAVGAGQFGDPRSEDFLVKAIGERRDAILRAYLPAVNPIVSPALSESGSLTFRNAAVDAGVAKPPPGYRAQWYLFDNTTHERRSLGETSGPTNNLATPRDFPSTPGVFITLELTATGGAVSWQQPVHVYFRRLDREWRLIGFERMP